MRIFKHEYKLSDNRTGSCYVLYREDGLVVAVLNELSEAQDLAARYIGTTECPITI